MRFDSARLSASLDNAGHKTMNAALAPSPIRHFPEAAVYQRSPKTKIALPALTLLVALWFGLVPCAAVAAVITVTTVSDDVTPNDGSVSLREAIAAIRAGNNLGDPDITAQNPGTFGTNDTINFNIPGNAVQTIQVGTDASASGIALPAITKKMTIDGYTQGVASPNTLANGDNAQIRIELDGASAGPNADGLELASDGSIVQGLAINRFSGNGIQLIFANNNSITGNFIGLNALGNAAEPNQLDGIRITAGAKTNTIGGTNPAARNLVSGNNLDGIHITSSFFFTSDNLIEGNFVGTNAAGTGLVGLRSTDGTPAGNFLNGIEISGVGAFSNTIGGTAAGSRNVVGLNLEGIAIDNGSQGNTIEGSFVGVGANGVTAVGNEQHGIVLRSSGNLAPPFGPGDSNEPAVSANAIGGTIAGSGNLVEFNGSAGVAIFGNPPQNNAVQAQNSGNPILGNSIFMNGRTNPSARIGIDLVHQFVYPADDGVTANTPSVHGGVNDPNNLQNFPILNSPTFSPLHTIVDGSLSQSVSPNTTYRIEFFSNTACSKTGFGEGQSFIGFLDVITNGSGTVSFSASLPLVLPTEFITATATNTTADPSSPNGSANVNNTSEFSKCVSDLIFRDGFE